MLKKSNQKCKQCRREDRKLFLKGERCFSPKCAMVKRNYPPGIHGVKRKSRLTPYGVQLREKQKIKRIYGIMERQLRKYFSEAFKKGGETGEFLLQKLEMRLDNIVFRLGFAKSRTQARQLVSHGHFLVNNRKLNIPSYQVKVGDQITISQNSKTSKMFENLDQTLAKYETPSWLALDSKSLMGRILAKPSKEEIGVDIDLKLIVEYYSR